MVDHREDLVVDRTGHQERLRWFLVEVGIAEPPARSLDRRVVLDQLTAELAGRTEPVARFARDLLERIRELTVAIDALERELCSPAKDIAPSLLALVGCGALTAAKLVGQTCGIGRFRSRAAFARHNGTAQVPVWSGNIVRHRLNRAGTAISTSPSTGSPSPSSSAKAPVATTWQSERPRATPRPRRSAPSVGASATRSSGE